MEIFVKSDIFNKIEAQFYCDDCLKILENIQDNSINLIITSPPYADQRKNTYDGIKPENYVNWFLPISKELLRVLRKDGTFILNIKEKVMNAERHTYVLELIIAMKKQGWLWTEEFIWKKTNAYPGKWPNRFRDAWERLLQFNKYQHFKMYQDAVMIPIGKWHKKRLANLGTNDKIRYECKTGSGFSSNISNWLNRDMVYPDNVVVLSTEVGNKKHSAAFPKSLPIWFIKLFTKEKDIVIDPFMGSGTSCVAAIELNRNCIGIEKKEQYYKIAKNNIKNICR